MLGDPEKRDGSHAESEGELGSAQGASAEEGGRDKEVKRTAGKEWRDEAHDESAASGGEFERAEAGARDDSIHKARTREFFPKAKRGDEEKSHQHPRKDNGGGIENPAEWLLTDGSANRANGGVGDEAAAVIAEISEEISRFALAGFSDAAGERTAHRDAVHARDQSGDEGGGDGEAGVHLLRMIGGFNFNGDRLGAVLHGCRDDDRPGGDEENEGKGHESRGMLEKCFHVGLENEAR